MIKTVPFDIPLSFIIGMLIPLVCPKGISASKSLINNRYFLAAVLFELFFFIPLGTYLYFFHPDWSLMYFVDPSALSQAAVEAIGLIALSSYMASTVAGFLVASRLIRSGKTSLATAVLIVLLVGLSAFSLVTMDQLTSVGSFSAWSATPKTTTPLYLHRIGYVIGVDALAAGAALVVLLRSLRRQESMAKPA